MVLYILFCGPKREYSNLNRRLKMGEVIVILAYSIILFVVGILIGWQLRGKHEGM